MHGGEREPDWGWGGGGSGSCSGKMTSTPVMSSSSQCQAVTRQRQRRRQTEKAESHEVTTPAVMSALELGLRCRCFNRCGGEGGTRDRGKEREDSSKSY